MLIKSHQLCSSFRADGDVETLTCELEGVSRADRKTDIVLHQAATETILKLLLAPKRGKCSHVRANIPRQMGCHASRIDERAIYIECKCNFHIVEIQPPNVEAVYPTIRGLQVWENTGCVNRGLWDTLL